MSRNKSDDRFFGAVLVAGVLGIVGAGAMSVGFGFGFASTVGIFMLIAAVVAGVLLLGWQDAPPPPPGPGTAPTVGSSGGAGWGAKFASPSSSSGGSGSGPSASGGSKEGDVALHTPTPTAAADHVSIGETVSLNTPETEPLPVYEGEPERPAALDAPRAGQPDDLQQIKGVGPALEKLCHSLGFYHYDQIAGWTDAEVAWVDQNLEGFKGRVTRDQWVSQARDLAAQKAPA